MVQVIERTNQLGQVIMACENIYSRCCERSFLARSRKSNQEEDYTNVLKEKLQAESSQPSHDLALARSPRTISPRCRYDLPAMPFAFLAQLQHNHPAGHHAHSHPPTAALPQPPVVHP